MTNTIYDIDMIDKYLTGVLNQTEQEIFDKKLKSDPNLVSDIDLQRTAINFITIQGRQDFKKKIKEVHLNEMIKRKRKKINLYAIAASVSVVFIISLSTIYFILTSTTNHEKLYASNFTPYQDVISSNDVRGESEDISEINKAYQFYNSKQYIEASKTFHKEIKNGNTEESTLFYYSISLLALNKYIEASKYLEKLILNNEGLFCEQARWYLALCYIGENNLTNATKTLESIIKEQSYNFSKAKELLTKIR